MKVGDSFFDLVMIIANVTNNPMSLIVIYVFNNKYEVKRIGKDRKNKFNECFLKKNWFVKCGDFYQYEEEYESTFSNGSTNSAKFSFSNMKRKLVGHP